MSKIISNNNKKKIMTIQINQKSQMLNDVAYFACLDWLVQFYSLVFFYRQYMGE